MMTSTEANTRRRVKLYMLNDERQWDDKGTGHVSALYTEQNNIALVVISENDGSCLLESKIHPETAYQKQQETLIVWSEGDNMDLALSFQEKAGCEDIWEKICSVQGKDPSVDITQDVVDESDDADDVESYTINTNQPLQTLDLPPCELSRLEEIAELISQPSAPLQRRERLVATFDRLNYVRQLIDLFHKAEDLEDMESLHHLYEIFRQLILFNKQMLYETLFSDELILDVIGVLEYNPAGRIRHRDFLRNQATFREVLPLHNTDLVNKIHQTYRVQYIQDCCLPPPCLFDEHTMSVLKSFISLNKIEIISALQDDEEFMLQLFTCLKSPDTSDSHRRELALFVKEFCNLSVQTDQKDNFLNCLFSHGALSTVEVLLTYEDRDVKAAALEILQAFVENQPSVVREYVCRDNPLRRDEHILINLMITQLLNDPDPELNDAFQLGYMLRLLIDPDNMSNASGRSEKTEFLSFFYKRCIGTLAKPLFDNTTHDAPLNDNYHLALVLNNVLELLTFCIESHAYHMKNYCLHRDLVKRVLVLLRSTHKFLVLCALRLLRRVVNMKEEFYNRYLMKNCLFKPVIDLFLANRYKYNMIDSAVIELFDFIHMETINSLIAHIVEKYWDTLKEITYVQTFAKLKERYDCSHRPNRTDSPSVFAQHASVSVIPVRTASNPRSHRVTTEFDDEEEQWFGQDDDDEEEDAPQSESLHQTISPTPSPTILLSNSVVTTPTTVPLDNLSTESSSLLSNSLSPQPNLLADGKVDKLIPQRSLPYALLPLADKNISEYVDSPLPRPGLIRQSTPISIHIKSTTLNDSVSKKESMETINIAPVENNENEVENGAQLMDVPLEPQKFVQTGEMEKNGDYHNSDEEVVDSRPIKQASKRLSSKSTPNKHSKRPALVATSMENSTTNEDFPNGHSSTVEKLVKISSNDKSESVVGLVDYSDEESDEETSPEEETKILPHSDVLPSNLPPVPSGHDTIQTTVDAKESIITPSHCLDEVPKCEKYLLAPSGSSLSET